MADEQRGKRKTAVGVVTSDRMNKTRRVEIPRLVKHPKYGKYIKRRTICYVHDEGNESRAGDTVEIMETRPLSKTKHWRLVRIVARAKAEAGGAAEAAPAE
jgi:small subunit ribosomal protein S17